MQRTLVIGAAGMLGRAVTRDLRAQGRPFDAVDFVPCEADGIGRFDLCAPDDLASIASGTWGTVINCAALNAVAIAGALQGFPAQHLPPLALARGSYFGLTGATPFSRLIYPAPEPGGLGVHLTLDLQGRARFGPDVEWIDAVDYSVDPARGERFYEAIRRYWPDLPDGALAATYCGIRPKIGPDPKGFADFMIQGPEVHGVSGLWNLFGIESPGLTSSLALGERVAAQVAARTPAA